MIYCDTSLLVTATIRASRAPAVHRWLYQHAAGDCAPALDHNRVSSAVSIKRRQGRHFGRRTRQRSWRDGLPRKPEIWSCFPFRNEAFNLAARFCEMKDSTLRAGDALHLAVASLGGHAMATLDARMREGAEAVGVGVVGV